MHTKFALFRHHIELAHQWWRVVLQNGDAVLDATCGNGHDTFFIGSTLIEGKIYALDIQAEAIESTKRRCSQLPEHGNTLHFFQCDHANPPDEVMRQKYRLIVYNLGYLPGANKTLITKGENTVKSLELVKNLLVVGGVLSVTCYSGHPGGKVEQESVLTWARTLPAKEWNVSWHQWIQSDTSPGLLIIQKRIA